MTTGTTISAIGHGLVLASGLLWFSAKPFENAPVDSVMVDVMSEREFSELTAGLKTAPKLDKPQPVVDRIGEPKEPAKDPFANVLDKPEIKTAEARPAAAPPKPAEPKPVAVPAAAESKPEAKKPEPDPIAEALKKEETKKKEEARKLEEAKRREEARRREEAKKREEQKFDLDKIEALLDKRTPQRAAVTGEVPNPTPSLGAPAANAPQLSQSEIDALRHQLMDCWNPPPAVWEAKDLIVTVWFALNRDGSLSGEPKVVNHGTNALFQVAAESAVRAVRSCQPFRLPVAKYEAWQELEGDFRPGDKVQY